MPTFEEIYAAHAAAYDRLVAREDYQGNILAALRAIRPLEGIDVIEMGAGTGRLTRLLAPIVGSIRAFDRSAHMLGVAGSHLAASGLSNWSLHVADHDALPAASASADLAIEGWSFGHVTEWQADRWQQAADAALAEMQRVLRPGGTAVLLETMGTAVTEPVPPHQTLADFYAWLADERGFQMVVIRTDYRFESLQEAVELAGFFFGPEMAARIERHGWDIVPEWTGVWWKRK